jgi:hypothetical protein
MAVTKTVLKNTNQETIIKVAGTAASSTIDLQTDCLASTQAISGATQTVNIVACKWCGLNNSTITITRNSVNILTLNGADAGDLDFSAGYGFVDSIENTSDVVVTVAGAEAQVYLTLRKVGGYATKVETAVFGAYDDQTAVGS